MASRYNIQKTQLSETNKQVLQTTTLPVVPERDEDVYIITNSMDRLDTLAYKFYGNPRHWWVIALANNLGKGTLMVEGGVQLRIPKNPTEIENLIKSINK